MQRDMGFNVFALVLIFTICIHSVISLPLIWRHKRSGISDQLIAHHAAKQQTVVKVEDEDSLGYGIDLWNRDGSSSSRQNRRDTSFNLNEVYDKFT